MFGNDRFVQVFGSVPAGDDEALIQVVSNAVREGFAIVLLKPGEKTPICTLSTRDRKNADVAAQTIARELDDARWGTRKHLCGINHALTIEWAGGDPAHVRTKVGALIRRVVKENGGRNPNIGVELGRSRMLVVDVDTMAEYQGFLSDWPDDGRDTQVPGLTVKSPGKQNIDGEWVHKNGGHYWFTIPDGVELPAYNGVYRAESGWVAMWADHQVLVPPSARAEGVYEIVGQVNPAPAWLTDQIIASTKARMDRVAKRTNLPDGTADIDVWATALPWADLLIADDWIDTGLPDRCGCPIFTAPGPHGSPKSATAHDVGCDRYDTSPGHAPLHVWTDNPPGWLAEAITRTGGKTFTKIQYLAWRDHNGSVGAATKSAGLRGDVGVLDGWEPADLPRPVAPEQPEPFDTPEADTGDGPEDSEPADAPTAADVGIDEPPVDDDSWKRIELHGRDEDAETPPTLMPRSDGAIALLYPGLIHSIHGESESGKSWIVQAEVARVVAGGGRVLFLDFENDYRAVLRRFRALGVTDQQLRLIDYRNPESAPDTGGAWWRGMFTGEHALIVLDGVTDALGLFKMGTKDNDDISTFLRKFPRQLARRTGAAVVLIDHVVKSPDGRGRWAIGGQAKMAGLDGAAYSVDVLEPLGRGLVGRLSVKVAKDKPGYVRGKASGFDKHRLGDIAVFTMDARGTKIVCRLDPPADPLDVDPSAGPDTDLTRTVLAILAGAEAGMSTSAIARAAHKRPDTINKLLPELEQLGYVEHGSGTGQGSNAKIWTITESGRDQVPE
jgi:hypothetical protein